MVDINEVLVATLNTIGLTVMLESIFTEETPTPCITYNEYSNKDTITGNTIEYSEVITVIKVWSPSLGVLMANAKLIDTKMKLLGLTRDFGAPLFVGGMGQYVLRYKVLVKQIIK